MKRRVAYADPPYLGMASRYDHPDAAIYDTVDGHGALLQRLADEFPDGWAYSLSSPSLRQLLPLCPEGVRVMAWVKPWCAFKPNVNPAYAWEPVVVWRSQPCGEDTERDWVSANITLKRGVVGAKPDVFCEWLFRVLGLRPEDEFVDLFPGSGAVTRAWERFRAEGVQGDLFA